jgi:hypothetical protein
MSPNAEFSPESAVEGGKIAFKPILTFSTSRSRELIHLRNLWPREQNAMEEGLQQLKDRAGKVPPSPPLLVSNL